MFQEPTAEEWIIALWLGGSLALTLVIMSLVVIAVAFCKLCKAAYYEVLYWAEKYRYHRQSLHRERT